MVIPLRDENPTGRFPVVTVLLIAANVFVFLALQPHGGEREARFTYERAAIPCEITHGRPLTYLEINTATCGEEAAQRAAGVAATSPKAFPGKNVYLAVLVSMFLHGSVLHLLGNMWFLWVFGDNVEVRLGRVGFLAFYLFVGVVAAMVHVLPDPGSTTPVVGASGAIAGVMGAYLVLWPRARVLTIVPILLFVLLYLPAAVVLLMWFALQFLTSPSSGVAWLAHVGGFVAGAAVGLVLRLLQGPPAPLDPWGAPGPGDEPGLPAR